MSENEKLRQYLEHRLTAWARWAIDHKERLGWASTSPIFALLLHGGINAANFGPRVPCGDDKEAEEVESWLAMLRQINHDQAEAIKLQYLERYDSLEELARRAKLNLSTLKNRLAGAKNFLLGLALGASNERYLKLSA